MKVTSGVVKTLSIALYFIQLRFILIYLRALMTRFFLSICVLLTGLFARGQNLLLLAIKDEGTKAVLKGATVQIRSLRVSAVANEAGAVSIDNIPNGKQEIEISNIGYKQFKSAFVFPLTSSDTIQILLEAKQLNWMK